jgi:hypothetical protein
MIKNFFFGLTATLGFFLVSCANTVAPLQTRGSLKLPIEVIGPDGYIEEVKFTLADASGIDRVYVQCHRCGYRDSSVNTTRGAKGSVRLNGGGWVNLDDYNAAIAEPEKSYGGIAGGAHTARFSVPISGAVRGVNTLQFRFNATDGFTSGYRILKFDLLRNWVGVLSPSLFSDDDPTLWAAPLSTQSAIQQGKTLWTTGAKLKESPLSTKILNASCSSCHAADGRDLKYFNYSNWSIQERSKFHGLTELEGQQIASYIRSLNTPAPKQARPWNPPYQPGPGLDSRPVAEWAAGAGIDAVLNSDKDMLPYLFPKGTSAAELEKVFSSKGTLNMREMPIAIQFPDWNAWLPEVAPQDVWSTFQTETPYGAYSGIKAEFASKGLTALAQQPAAYRPAENLDYWPTQASYLLDDLGGRIFHWLRDGTTEYGCGSGASLRARNGKAMESRNTVYSLEDAKSSLIRWSQTKYWEVMQEFQLEDKSGQVFGNKGVRERMGWPIFGHAVYQTAPHFIADGCVHMKYQTPGVGALESSAWYQLQTTLQAGERVMGGLTPVDWVYNFQHISRATQYNDNVANPVMYYQNLIKMYQNGDNGDGPKSGGHWSLPPGWLLRFTHPRLVLFADQGSGGTSAASKLLERLNTYEPNLRAKLTAATINSFMTVVESFPESAWDRCVTEGYPRGNDHWSCVDPADYVPKAINFAADNALWHEYLHPDTFRYMIPELRRINTDPAAINRLIAWCKTMWPAGGWDSY